MKNNIQEIINTLSEVQKVIEEKDTLIETLHKTIQEKDDIIESFNNDNGITAFLNPSINSDQESITVGINNLDLKNEEAIHDAIVYFDKKCPYCGEDLYKTTNRKKFEVDHFFPIVNGGQNYPWNILPVCKSCNRKKRAKLPHDFLDEAVFTKCSQYLAEIKNKFQDKSIIGILDQDSLQKLIKDNMEFISLNIKNKFISSLMYLAGLTSKHEDLLKYNNQNISELERVCRQIFQESNGWLSNDEIKKAIYEVCDIRNVTPHMIGRTLGAIGFNSSRKSFGRGWHIERK